jgi:flavin-binding protein dodecin
MVRGATKESDMSVAKIIEVSASSKTSVEDAVRTGLKKVAETVKGIQGGNITEWRVNLRVTFLVQ